MIELKTQYPYIDFNGTECVSLIKHYAEDENGELYKILQVETNIEYDHAVDIYPCKFTYEITDKKVEEEIDIDANI